MIVIFPILNDVARVQGLSFILWAIVDLQLALWMILNLAYGQFLHRITVLCVDYDLYALSRCHWSTCMI